MRCINHVVGLHICDTTGEQIIKEQLYRAISLRHKLYYEAPPNSDIETWANELGDALSRLAHELGILPAMPLEQPNPPAYPTSAP
jgi:hypothetical protein